MQINPRYDGEPLVRVEGPADTAVAACARQRRRLAATLAGFDEAQWAAPTRCEGWTVKDVISHLTSTNGFWSISIASAIAGSPTRFLEGFDPKATPAALADADAATGWAEARDRFADSTEALCSSIEALSAEQLTMPGEAPPGHIAVHGVVLHALWDSWVHERDILLPQGLPVVADADEITESLRYGIALAPALALTGDPSRQGQLGLAVDDPGFECWIEAGPEVVVHAGPAPDGTPVVRGAAVDVLEGLSVRQPLEVDVADDARWMVDGLAVIFEER